MMLQNSIAGPAAAILARSGNSSFVYKKCFDFLARMEWICNANLPGTSIGAQAR